MPNSIFNNITIKALIEELKNRQNNHEHLFESDYSLILGAILPHYFKFNNNVVISPEMWSNDKRRSDYVASKINVNRNAIVPYGHATPLLMAECKKRWAISWANLVKDQLWNQADSLKNAENKLWVIGLIGFEICVFKFDLLNYNWSNTFTNFSPVNLNNFSIEDLDELEIKHVSESIGRIDVIQVIQWRLDDNTHHIYIHNMLDYISKNNP